MTRFQVLDNRRNVVGEYDEHPTFERYRAPCGLVYVSLVVGEGRSKRFILSDLRQVEAPPKPVHQPAWEVNPRAIQLWKPVIQVTPDMIGVEGIGGKNGRKAVPGILIDQCIGVDIKVA